MRLVHAMGWFFSGVLAVNAIPHLIHGLSGNRFPSPFARPPGRGLSSPILNVVWSFANILGLGVILYFNHTTFGALSAAIMFGGGLGMGILLASYFSRKDRE